MRKLVISSVALLLFATSLAIADDKADVKAAIENWGKAVADGCTSDPNKIANLYAKDGVL